MEEVAIFLLLQSTDINESSVYLKVLIYSDVLLCFTEYRGKPDEGFERIVFVWAILTVRYSPPLFYYVVISIF